MEKFDMILSLYNPKGVLVKKPKKSTLLTCNNYFSVFAHMQSVKEEYVVYDGYALFADMGGLARHSTKNTYSKIFSIF